MNPKNPRTKWKPVTKESELISSDFYDSKGSLIGIGDTIEYVREKRSDRYGCEKDTVVQVVVDEIFLRAKKFPQGIFYLKAILVKNPQNYSCYRLYDTSHVIKVQPKKKQFKEIESSILKPVCSDLKKGNDDVFSIGLPL